MPDHLHLIADGEKKEGVIQRFINSIVSRRVIDFLKVEGYSSSLEKIRRPGMKSIDAGMMLASGSSSELSAVDE